MPEYAKKEYWNKQYAEKDEYDWYINYSDLRSYLISAMPSKDAVVLIVGCGNSTLAADLYKDGYKNIECVDYSDVVISKMRKKYTNLPIKFDVDNVQTMRKNATYVIDKGTLDAIACGENSSTNIDDMVNRIHEALIGTNDIQPRFIEITFGTPESRLHYFDKHKWNVKVEQITKSHGGFIYVYNCVPKIPDASVVSNDVAIEMPRTAIRTTTRAGAGAGTGVGCGLVIFIVIVIIIVVIILFFMPTTPRPEVTSAVLLPQLVGISI